MRRELRAEWTKLRTSPGTGWLLFAIVALTVASSAAADALATETPADIPRFALIGVQLGQVVVAILAVQVVSSEYGTGLIRVTLAAMPRRTAVMAAKAALVGALTLATGTAAVLGSVLAGWLLVPGLTLANGPAVRAVAGSVLYLALFGLFALGVATVVRNSAAAVGVTLGIPYLLWTMRAVIGSEQWGRALYRISPMDAGLTIQATADLGRLPIGPWAGLGVLAAWSCAALLGGGLLLNVRDA